MPSSLRIPILSEVAPYQLHLVASYCESDQLALALTFEPALLEQAIEIRERVAGAANPFNACRAALKEVKKVQAGEAGDLWKAAGEAIQQRKSVAAVAGPAQSPSAETQDGQGQQEPAEEEDEPEQGNDEDHAPGESAQPPGLG